MFDTTQLLREEFPTIETFVTLSPIPRFRKWLEAKVSQNDDSTFFDETLLSDQDFVRLTESGLLAKTPSTQREAYSMFLDLLQEVSFSSTELQTTSAETVLRPILMKLAARYLVLEKHRGKPLDGVGRFHIGNGAEVFRINYGADLSRKGVQNSFGMMVNYRYDLSALATNQHQFELDYSFPVSPDVAELLHPASDHGEKRSRL